MIQQSSSLSKCPWSALVFFSHCLAAFLLFSFTESMIPHGYMLTLLVLFFDSWIFQIFVSKVIVVLHFFSRPTSASPALAAANKWTIQRWIGIWLIDQPLFWVRTFEHGDGLYELCMSSTINQSQSQ